MEHKYRHFYYSLVFVVCLIIVMGCGSRDTHTVTLTVDPDTRYQTIEGWGATLSSPAVPFHEWDEKPTPENYDKLEVKALIPEDLKEKLLDAAVFELGLNRFRLEIGPQIEMHNDNGDPQNFNYEAFRFKWQDFLIRQWLLPLKERIERRGDPMVLYISYDLGSSLTPAWLLQPDEYAEMAVATLIYLKRTYDLEPDYWSVLNEPGNHRPGNPELVAQLIAHTGERFKKAGFHTRMSGPEVVTPRQITKYMKALKNTPNALKYMGQLTYHLYWDPTNISHRNEIRDWAHQLGITAAQTEWLEGINIGVMEALFLDLTEANASAWEQYGLCWTANRYNKGGGGDYFVINPGYSTYYMNTNTWYLRQIMNYVRPGDVRIEISSSDPKIKPMAFLKADGRQTLVIINSDSKAEDIEIKNLSPGRYHIIQTDHNEKGKKLAPQFVKGGGTLEFRIPGKGVITFQGI